MSTDATDLGLLPVPMTDDHDSGPFWAGCAERRLLIAIGADDVPIHPPVLVGTEWGPVRWIESDGRATLHTWTVVEHAVDPAFPAPYTLVLVQLDDFPTVRFIGMLESEIDLTPGMPMRLRWEERSGVIIPQWEPDISGE